MFETVKNIKERGFLLSSFILSIKLDSLFFFDEETFHRNTFLICDGCILRGITRARELLSKLSGKIDTDFNHPKMLSYFATRIENSVWVQLCRKISAFSSYVLYVQFCNFHYLKLVPPASLRRRRFAFQVVANSSQNSSNINVFRNYVFA